MIYNLLDMVSANGKSICEGRANLTGSSISTERSKLLFRETKLQKNVERKAICD